jgi:hypothetical protein
VANYGEYEWLVSVDARGHGGSDGGGWSVPVFELAELSIDGRCIWCRGKNNDAGKLFGLVTFGAAVGQRVAVVAWQWYRSTRETSAVRMVVD